MSVIESLVLLSKGGTGIFSSSNLDTKLKYLFNSSHFLNDVDDMVEEFTKSFLDIARQSIPTKTITVRDYNKPWFNNLFIYQRNVTV
jgi:hypothetical protein